MSRIKYSDHVQALEERRSKLPRNVLDVSLQSTNKPRTASKQALLKKIKEGAGRTGIDWTADTRKKNK